MSEFFEAMRAFLPKRVSLIPSMRTGMVTFLVAMALGVIIYTQVRPDSSKTYVSREEQKIEETKKMIFDIIFSLCLISLSVFLSGLAYDLQFYLDSRRLNGEWFVYKRYFPILFR